MEKFISLLKLIIDIGNSSVKVGLFDKKKLIKTTSFDECTLTNLAEFIRERNVSKGILSSVKNIDNHTYKVIKRYRISLFDEKMRIPIKITYTNPEALGKDRIAGIVAGAYLYEGKDILVCD